MSHLSQQEVEAMLGRDLKQSRIYQDAKAEGRIEGRAEGLLLGKLEVVPLLLEVGLTVEAIAAKLGLEAAVIRQAMTVVESRSPNLSR